MDFRTLAKRIIMTLLALLILPYLLIPVYALPFMRPVSTLMLADLVTLQGYDRRWVPLEDISPRLVQSVMMSEDGQFCFHGGVDWNQMQSVVNNALEGASTRGASTIPSLENCHTHYLVYDFERARCAYVNPDELVIRQCSIPFMARRYA